MTLKKTVKKLKLVTKEKGVVYVAYHLKFRETGSIYKYLKEEKIPARNLDQIQKFLETEKVGECGYKKKTKKKVKTKKGARRTKSSTGTTATPVAS